ncbi:hypothetical protein [Azospirillum sp. sgz301742]
MSNYARTTMTDGEHARAVALKRAIRAKWNSGDRTAPREWDALRALIDAAGDEATRRWYSDWDDEGPMPQPGNGDSEGGAA